MKHLKNHKDIIGEKLDAGVKTYNGTLSIRPGEALDFWVIDDVMTTAPVFHISEDRKTGWWEDMNFVFDVIEDDMIRRLEGLHASCMGTLATEPKKINMSYKTEEGEVWNLVECTIRSFNGLWMNVQADAILIGLDDSNLMIKDNGSS